MDKARILIVEDEAIIAMDIERQLQGLGYKVTSIVSTGEKVIEKAEADNPDIILMDIRIKGEMDGIDAAEIIRNRFGIPVIFSTAYLDQERIERAKITMPFGYVLKPIQERDLKVTLEMALYVAKVDAERKKSEAKYRDLVDFLPQGIYETDELGNLIFANRTALEMFGYSEADLEKGFNILQIVAPEDRNRAASNILKVLDGQQFGGIEYSAITKMGKKFPILTYSSFINVENKVIHQGIVIDITKRKQAESALKESEIKFRNIVENSTNLFYSHTADHVLTYLSPQSKDILGYDPEEALIRWIELASDNPINEIGFGITQKAIDTGKRQPPYELELKQKSGKKVRLEIRENPIVVDDKTVSIVGSATDVTDQKKAEHLLKESEKNFRLLFEFSPLGIYLASPDGTILDANQALLSMLGSQSVEATRQINVLEFPPLIENGYSKKFIECVETGKIVTIELLYKSKWGKEAFISNYIVPLKDDNGKVEKIYTIMRNVTKRRQAEEAVIKERDFATAILRWVESIVVVMDLDGYVVIFNKAAEKCSGYTLEEVRQKPFWESLVPPRESKSVKEAIMNVKTKSLPNENLNHWVTKDGKECLIHWFNSVLNGTDGAPEYILCTGLDITERSQFETALQRSEDHNKSILENMQEGYFENDLAGNFTMVNQSLADTLGYSIAELIGMNNRTIMDKKTARKVLEIFIDVFLSGKPQKYLSYEVIHKSGDIRTVEVSTSLMYHSDGEPIGFFGVSRDVTDRKRMDELMIQTEKMMSVGGLAAGMAHELNNPLGGMLQGIQNVQRRLSPDLKSNLEPAREFGIDLRSLQLYMEKRGIHSFIKGTLESGKKASQIISSMLQFGRKSESKLASANLAELIENAVDLAGKDYDLKKKYDFRNIKIIREFDSEMPLIPCTKTEIEQVILNLLKNAAHAMAEKNNNDSPQIILRVNIEKQMARIELEDNGPGMDEAVRKRILEPFFTTKPLGEGTGLGLSVSYMIITSNHKGTMEVESEPGRGTKFIIRLPLNRELVS